MLNVYINNTSAKFYLGMTNNEKAKLNQMRLPEDLWAFNFELINTD